MRTYLSNNIYNSLPSDLQLIIKTVDKKSDIGNKNTTDLVTTQNKLFLLSLEEVGFLSNDVYEYNVDGQGTKYEYFTDDASRVKSNLSGESSFWWLRSTYTNDTNNFFFVYFNGDWNYFRANGVNGVVPAFCI